MRGREERGGEGEGAGVKKRGRVFFFFFFFQKAGSPGEAGTDPRRRGPGVHALPPPGKLYTWHMPGPTARAGPGAEAGRGKEEKRPRGRGGGARRSPPLHGHVLSPLSLPSSTLRARIAPGTRTHSRCSRRACRPGRSPRTRQAPAGRAVSVWRRGIEVMKRERSAFAPRPVASLAPRLYHPHAGVELGLYHPGWAARPYDSRLGRQAGHGKRPARAGRASGSQGAGQLVGGSRFFVLLLLLLSFSPLSPTHLKIHPVRPHHRHDAIRHALVVVVAEVGRQRGRGEGGRHAEPPAVVGDGDGRERGPRARAASHPTAHQGGEVRVGLVGERSGACV